MASISAPACSIVTPGLRRADRLQPVIGALREVFWIQRQGIHSSAGGLPERVEYDAGASRKIEAARHHAYDREAAAVDRDRPADDSWIAAESSAPQAVAEDGHLIAAGLLLLRQKEAAPDGSTPSVAKRSAETRVPWTGSGRSSPERLNFASNVKAEMRSNALLCCRHSTKFGGEATFSSYPCFGLRSQR